MSLSERVLNFLKKYKSPVSYVKEKAGGFVEPASQRALSFLRQHPSPVSCMRERLTPKPIQRTETTPYKTGYGQQLSQFRGVREEPLRRKIAQWILPKRLEAFLDSDITSRNKLFEQEKDRQSYLIEKGKLKDITLNRHTKNFIIGIGGTTEGMIGAAEWISPKSIKPFFKEKGDQTKLWQQKMIPEDRKFIDDLVTGAGSMVTFFIPGMGVAKAAQVVAKVSPKLALLFGNVAATALESATEAGFIYRQKKELGVGEKEASWAATKTFIANSILIGLTNKFGAFSSGTKSAFKRMVMSSPIEGLQEYWQEVIQNVNMGKPAFEGALRSGTIGAILGLPMGGISGLSFNNLETTEQHRIVEEKILSRVEEISKGIKPGLTIEEVGIPKELEPLAKEARKYKSAEEFVKNYDGGLLVDKNKFYKFVEGGPSNEVKISNILTNTGKKELKGLNLQDIPIRIKEMGEKELSKGIEANIYWDSKTGMKDAYIDIVISPFDAQNIIEGRRFFGLKDVEQNILHELTHARQLMLGRADTRTVKALEKTADKSALFRYGKLKSQLTDIYTQATKAVKEVKPVVKPKLPAVKPKITTKGIIRKTTGQIKSTEFKQRMTDLVRGMREGRVLTKDEIAKAQNEIIDILDKSALERNDKAKFIHAIKNVQTTEQLQKALPVIQERIEALEQAELSRSIQSQINKSLKYVRPLKVGQKRIAKYDYQTNKFLERLRKNNKLNQEQSQLGLNKIPIEGLSELDKIETRFLSLKANGAKSSVLLYEQVLADIQYLKEIGKTAKDEADFIKKIEKQEKVDEILNEIKQQKNVLFKKSKTLYISSVANLYSTINIIAGKKIADKYDYGIFQTNSQHRFGEQVEKATDKAKEIYNVKSNRQLNKVFLEDLIPTNWTITDTTGLKTEINKFNLIDIYNATKNDLIKERYDNAFGEEQVNALLQNLTEEDVRMADYLMKEVQSYKDILNQRSIEITGRDLGEVENYWPSTSEFDVNFYDDIKIQGETPSAMKERVKSSNVIPRIDNAWLKFQRHIAQGEHVKTISKRYEELKKLFSDRIVKHNIKNKFGDEVYTTLIDHIETFSLNKRTQLLDVFSGVYNTGLNNWVKAKIASPTVFARQLISSIYSVEKVGIKNYLKYQTEAVQNPKMAFDYMWKNIPFLSSRFKQGYSEALQDAIKGSSELKVGMGSITKYVTLMTRGGDITAIIINGYPIIKTEMAKHGNMEKAIEEFQKFSEKTQQSGSRANLSRLQRERNAFARTFFRFKNTTNQLLRLQTDATIQYANKQITAKEFATKTTLYSIYTPLMYVLIGYIITQGFKGLFGADDEKKKESLLGDMLAQIIIQPFQALPLLDMGAENAYAEIRKRITGKTYYFGGGMFSYPLLDDIETGWSKLKKKEPDASDFLRVFSLLQEPMTGIPTETILRYYGYTKPKGKKSTGATAPSGMKSGMPSMKDMMGGGMKGGMPSMKDMMK